jgi:hypothetical protein
VGVIEVLFYPRAGDAEGAAGPGAGDRWKIIVENDAVSILDDTDGGRRRLIGSGQWTGKGIGRRYAAGAPIDSSTWSQMENALRRAIGRPAGVVAPQPQPPPAAAGPLAAGGYAELILELATGDVIYQQRARSERRALNAFEWKIVVEDTLVIVHAHDEDAFAYAKWDGERLADREVRSKRGRTVNDYQWGLVEKVASEAITGYPAPVPLAAYDSATSGTPRISATPSEAPAAQPRPRPKSPPKDRRSGWWAFAAAGLALGGTLVSWKTMPPGDSVALGITIALGVLTLGLVIYGGYGLGTRCPNCKAWYRREITSTDNLGTSTFTRQESKPVYDSSGKQTGTTYETVTYERTEYRYHYQCKECRHRWTGHGSSETRIG